MNDKNLGDLLMEMKEYVYRNRMGLETSRRVVEEWLNSKSRAVIPAGVIERHVPHISVSAEKVSVASEVGEFAYFSHEGHGAVIIPAIPDEDEETFLFQTWEGWCMNVQYAFGIEVSEIFKPIKTK
jgi:hypothetical protein